MEQRKLEISKLLFEAARQTWQTRTDDINQIICPNNNYSGVRFIKIANLPRGTVLSSNSDGVGTKVEVAERMLNHSTIAYDLFAMVCDDAVSSGLEPILVNTVLDVNSLKSNQEVIQLIKGYVRAAREAGVSIISGETAELGSRVSGYGKFNYNWCATLISLGNESRIITGQKVEPNQYLVGLKEQGFRSNGLTLVRKTLEEYFGEEWHTLKLNNFGEHASVTLGELVLTPSKIYTRAIIEITGGWDLWNEQEAELTGIAHITGSGIPEKLGRVLRVTKTGALIDNPFEPCEVMKYCQDLGNISDQLAYSTWNMGQGMILITTEPDRVMQILEKYKIESKVIGKTTSQPGIRIKSKGVNLTNQYLDF